MATEKQIAANRANAKRSTGPKTVVGKSKSSRNAYRHGLSIGLPLEATTSEALEAITRALAGDGASDEQLVSVAEFSQAHLELLRIRKVRAEMMAAIDIGSADLQSINCS